MKFETEPKNFIGTSEIPLVLKSMESPKCRPGTNQDTRLVLFGSVWCSKFQGCRVTANRIVQPPEVSQSTAPCSSAAKQSFLFNRVKANFSQTRRFGHFIRPKSHRFSFVDAFVNATHANSSKRRTPNERTFLQQVLQGKGSFLLVILTCSTRAANTLQTDHAEGSGSVPQLVFRWLATRTHSLSDASKIENKTSNKLLFVSR